MINKTSKVRKNIRYSNKSIKNAIQGIITSCYGVFAFAHADLEKASKTKNNKTVPDDSVVITKTATNVYTINIYVILCAGVKMSEVLSEVQKRVTYELRKAYGLKIASINVYAQDIDNG